MKLNSRILKRLVFISVIAMVVLVPAMAKGQSEDGEKKLTIATTFVNYDNEF